MPMNRPFGTDANGNSRPFVNYVPIDDATLTQEALRQLTLMNLSASAKARMEASGKEFTTADVDIYLEAKGLTTQQRMLVKTHMRRSGDTAPKALKHLRLG
jgi:hypothetical protein